VKTLANKRIWLGMLAVALAFSLTVAGCVEEPNNNDNTTTSTSNPLTGTVTVSSNVAVNTINGSETMTLTADTSGLNITNPFQPFSYQWIRDGSNISDGGRGQTYDVTADDYGKTLKVRVTYPGYSGEQTGEFAVQSPTALSLTLKWASSAGKKDTYIIIERENGGSWLSGRVPSTGNLTETGSTITLTSWKETQFKMRTNYTFIESKFYFKKDDANGSELFDFTVGTKSYTLTNVVDQFNALTGLFATEN
jgi:hypothetical protein